MILWIINIASSSATWSSNDILVAKEINNKKIHVTPIPAIKQETEYLWNYDKSFTPNFLASFKNHVSRNTVGWIKTEYGEKVVIKDITPQEDGSFTIYSRDLDVAPQFPHTANKADLENRTKYWQERGFTQETYNIHFKNKSYQTETKRTEKIRELQHYLNLNNVTNIKDYQGGLSDIVFWNEELQNYLKPNKDGKICAFGYIGNNTRKSYLDHILEDFLREELGLTDSKIANWLSSSDGRHFADNYGENAEHLVKYAFTNYDEKGKQEGHYIVSENIDATVRKYQNRIDKEKPKTDKEAIRELKGYVFHHEKHIITEAQGGFSDRSLILEQT